jgi:hypothetical protein
MLLRSSDLDAMMMERSRRPRNCTVCTDSLTKDLNVTLKLLFRVDECSRLDNHESRGIACKYSNMAAGSSRFPLTSMATTSGSPVLYLLQRYCSSTLAWTSRSNSSRSHRFLSRRTAGHSRIEFSRLDNHEPGPPQFPDRLQAFQYGG